MTQKNDIWAKTKTLIQKLNNETVNLMTFSLPKACTVSMLYIEMF